MFESVLGSVTGSISYAVVPNRHLGAQALGPPPVSTPTGWNRGDTILAGKRDHPTVSV